jgi:hypothetical protein
MVFLSCGLGAGMLLVGCEVVVRPHWVQEYGQVIRMLGNGRLEAQCIDGKKRLCHIRGKMRKKVWVGQVWRGRPGQVSCPSAAHCLAGLEFCDGQFCDKLTQVPLWCGRRPSSFKQLFKQGLVVRMLMHTGRHCASGFA